jgi:conjugative relaxase-like TrwC/TraI family protein
MLEPHRWRRRPDGPRVVLTIHVVRQGGHGYYVGGLVAGRAQGTRVSGEEPGVWSGRGAAAMGLGGAVEASAFAQVLEGRHAASGSALRRTQGSHRVAGYDFTFAAPKSVSLLHLLATREIATEVGAGHRAAVDEATDYLERAAMGVRRSRHGQVTLLPATGAVAGQFLHRTSRALDPHLHTHLVVANVTQGVDGAWSTVDSRRLFTHAPAAQGIYHARLRLELHHRLGAAWEVRPSGLGDVVGVDAGLRHLFSQRTAAMAEYEVERYGRAPTRDHRRGSFHATRPAKDTDRTVEALIAEWKARATDLGYDPGDLSRVVGLGTSRDGVGRDVASTGPAVDLDRVRSGLARAAGHRSSLSGHHLVAVVAAASVTGATARTVEVVAGRIAEASGPALVPDRSGHRSEHADRPAPVGRDPRWSSASVAEAVGRIPEAMVLMAPTGSSRTVGDATLVRSDPAVDRGLDRHTTPTAVLDLGR